MTPEETGFPGNALPSVHNDRSGKPCNIPHDNRSCCQFLALLFSNDIGQEFVTKTNIHAEMIGKKYALAIEELNNYFTITLLYIGVCIKYYNTINYYTLYIIIQ